MKGAQVVRPKELANFKATIAASVVFVLVYFAGSYARPWNPKHGLGLTFGTIATLVFVFEMAYPARRRAAWPLGKAKHWLQAHLYLGALGFLATLIHTGFHLPHGVLGWSLLILSAWTTATGALGVWLQKWIPASLAEGLRVEALYERIPALVEQVREEADKLVEGATDVLDTFYRGEVRPALLKVNPSWSFLLDVQGGRERALEPFRRIAQFVGAEEKDKVQDLMALFVEKTELDAQYSLQGILRRWLVLHVPTAGVLMGLLAAHIVAWALY